jgi:hypothetical protein
MHLLVVFIDSIYGLKVVLNSLLSNLVCSVLGLRSSQGGLLLIFFENMNRIVFLDLCVSLLLAHIVVVSLRFRCL